MKTPLRIASVIGLLAALALGPSLIASDNPPTDTDPPSAPAQPKLVNINTATRAELEKLPAIGRVLAERIIAGRPYKTIDELKKIEGLGDKTFAAIKPLVTLE